MHRSLIAVAAGILAISVSVGAVPASAARTVASSFELTSEDWFGDREFAAAGAFCPSGRMEALSYDVQLLTCADGSGTARALVSWAWPEGMGNEVGTWRLVGGTGAYEKLRGQGTFTSVETGAHEPVCDQYWGCDYVPIVRTSWSGVADLDDVPPALRIVSARASKLERKAGAYALELALELGDQFEASPVPYALRVTTGLRTVAWVSGTAETPNLDLTVPIRPGKRALSVRVHLTASDSLGNESKLSGPMIALPR